MTSSTRMPPTKKKAQRARRAGDRRPVPERAHDQKLGARMGRQRDSTSVRAGQLLPAKCLKELHSPALQEANTHRLFIKL